MFAFQSAGPEDFRAVLLSEFLVRTSSVSARLRLTNVADGPPDARIVQYALTFEGAAGLPEGIHEFRHDQLGAFELFVVPATDRVSKMAAYHAYISRMREA